MRYLGTNKYDCFQFEEGKFYLVVFKNVYLAIFHEINRSTYIEDICWFFDDWNNKNVAISYSEEGQRDDWDIYFELTEDEYEKHVLMEVL